MGKFSGYNNNKNTKYLAMFLKELCRNITKIE